MELFKAFVTRPAIVTDGEVNPMSAPDADLMGMILLLISRDMCSVLLCSSCI